MELESGERTIFEGHPSWRSILSFYLKGLLIGAAAAVIAGLAGSTGLGAGVAAAALVILLIAGYVKRIFTVYVITDRRLYIKRGIIARREQQTRLDRVQNVNTKQSVIERLLQTGTVDFDTAAGDDYEFSFTGVGDPQEVVHAVHRAQGA